MPTEGEKVASYIKVLPKIGHWGSSVVYVTMGLLVLLATIGSNTRPPDVRGSLLSIKDQPGGSFLLIGIFVCLLCLFCWKLLQAFWDLEAQGKTWKGLWRRTGYAGSAMILLGVSILIIKVLLDQPTVSPSAIAEQHASELTKKGKGWVVLVLSGCVVAVVAGWYAFLGIRGNFHGVFQCDQMSRSQKRWCFTLGRIGYIAKGMMLGAISYFIIEAGLKENSRVSFSQSGALNALLTSDMGTIISALIGIGLVGFGCFELAEAKFGRLPHRKIEQVVNRAMR